MDICVCEETAGRGEGGTESERDKIIQLYSLEHHTEFSKSIFTNTTLITVKQQDKKELSLNMQCIL